MMNGGFGDMIIFLTACVNPGDMCFTELKDTNVRLTQYLNAVKWYINNTSYPILLVENTGFDFKPYFKDHLNRVECLTFHGTQDPQRGKGYGEGEILRFGFKHSSFIKNGEEKLILKISGRYIIKNLKNELKFINILPHSVYESDDFVITLLHKSDKTAVSYCFIASRVFFERCLLNKLLLCDDSKNICFEHVLYETIQQYSKHYFTYPLDLFVDAVLGSTGQVFWTPTWRSHFHQIRGFFPQLFIVWTKTLLANLKLCVIHVVDWVIAICKDIHRANNS